MACRSGKQEHATREDALAAQKHLVWLNHVRGHDEKSAGLNVYPCDGCGSWHFGHSTSQAPLVYHYAYVEALDAIAEGALRPPPPTRFSTHARRLHTGKTLALICSIEERTPLLWFTWCGTWDPRSAVLPHPGRFYAKPSARHIDEGIIRVSSPAWVAKLRWPDYVKANKSTAGLQRAFTASGNPAHWLATDQPVSSGTIRSLEMWCGDAWRDAEKANA